MFITLIGVICLPNHNLSMPRTHLFGLLETHSYYIPNSCLTNTQGNRFKNRVSVNYSLNEDSYLKPCPVLVG